MARRKIMTTDRIRKPPDEEERVIDDMEPAIVAERVDRRKVASRVRASVREDP
jgi:hypothetical protein